MSSTQWVVSPPVESSDRKALFAPESFSACQHRILPDCVAYRFHANSLGSTFQFENHHVCSSKVFSSKPCVHHATQCEPRCKPRSLPWSHPNSSNRLANLALVNLKRLAASGSRAFNLSFACKCISWCSRIGLFNGTSILEIYTNLNRSLPNYPYDLKIKDLSPMIQCYLGSLCGRLPVDEQFHLMLSDEYWPNIIGRIAKSSDHIAIIWRSV